MGNLAEEYKQALAYASENREISLETLPISYDSGRGWSGLFLCGFALLWGGIPTSILIGSIVNGKFEPAMLMILLFTIIGLGIFLFGLSMIFRREKINLSQSEIRVERKRMTGSENWSEPLSTYAGIDSFERQVKTKNSSYTVYSLILVHSDPSKNVCLYSSRKGEGHRAMQEAACRALNLPAISGRDQTGFVTRGITDLDKSVKDLVREGKLRPEFNPAAQVPADIELKTEADGLTVRWNRNKARGQAGCLIPLIAGIIIALVASVFFVGGGFFMIFVAVFAFVVTAAIVMAGYVKEEMVINPSVIKTRITTERWGTFFEKKVETAKIEEIQIKEGKMAANNELLIITDRNRISFGRGLSRESLEWLRECVTYIISR